MYLDILFFKIFFISLRFDQYFSIRIFLIFGFGLIYLNLFLGFMIIFIKLLLLYNRLDYRGIFKLRIEMQESR